jgi:hypothetical protein
MIYQHATRDRESHEGKDDGVLAHSWVLAVLREQVQAPLVRTGGGRRWPGYASRRWSTQNATASRAAASTTKMPVSMPWNAQNLLAGW